MADIGLDLTLIAVVGGGLFVATKLGVLGGAKAPGPPNNTTPLIGAFTPGDATNPPGAFMTTPADTVNGAICAAHGGVYDAGYGRCFGNDNGVTTDTTPGGNW